MIIVSVENVGRRKSFTVVDGLDQSHINQPVVLGHVNECFISLKLTENPRENANIEFREMYSNVGNIVTNHPGQISERFVNPGVIDNDLDDSDKDSDDDLEVEIDLDEESGSDDSDESDDDDGRVRRPLFSASETPNQMGQASEILRTEHGMPPVLEQSSETADVEAGHGVLLRDGDHTEHVPHEVASEADLTPQHAHTDASLTQLETIHNGDTVETDDLQRCIQQSLSFHSYCSNDCGSIPGTDRNEFSVSEDDITLQAIEMSLSSVESPTTSCVADNYDEEVALKRALEETKINGATSDEDSPHDCITVCKPNILEVAEKLRDEEFEELATNTGPAPTLEAVGHSTGSADEMDVVVSENAADHTAVDIIARSDQGSISDTAQRQAKDLAEAISSQGTGLPMSTNTGPALTSSAPSQADQQLTIATGGSSAPGPSQVSPESVTVSIGSWRERLAFAIKCAKPKQKREDTSSQEIKISCFLCKKHLFCRRNNLDNFKHHLANIHNVSDGFDILFSVTLASLQEKKNFIEQSKKKNIANEGLERLITTSVISSARSISSYSTYLPSKHCTKLARDDMSMFGQHPLQEKPIIRCCMICSKIVKIEAFEFHMRRHGLKVTKPKKQHIDVTLKPLPVIHPRMPQSPNSWTGSNHQGPLSVPLADLSIPGLLVSDLPTPSLTSPDFSVSKRKNQQSYTKTESKRPKPLQPAEGNDQTSVGQSDNTTNMDGPPDLTRPSPNLVSYDQHYEFYSQAYTHSPQGRSLPLLTVDHDSAHFAGQGMPDVTGGQLPQLGARVEVAPSPEEALVSVGQVKAPDNLRTEPLLSPASGPPSLMPSSDRSLFMKTREQTEEDVAMHQVQQPPGEERIDLRHYYVTIHFILQGLHSRGWLLVTASPRPLCHRSSHSRGLSRVTMTSRCSTSCLRC